MSFEAGVPVPTSAQTYTINASDGSRVIDIILVPSSKLNVLDFGAKGDGIANDTAAVNAAIAKLKTTSPNHGGVVYFPLGTYNTDGIVLDSLVNVQLVGEGGPSSGNLPGSVIQHNTSKTNYVISAQHSLGTRIQGLTIAATTTSAGCIDLGHTTGSDAAYWKVSDNFIKSALTGIALNLSKSIDGGVYNNHFINNATGIQTTPADGSGYCNGVVIQNNTFHYGSTTAGNAHIFGLGAGLLIQGNTFEGGAASNGIGANGILCNTSMANNQGASIISNWFGDVTLNDGSYQMTLYGKGIFLSGNLVGYKGINLLNNCSGIVAHGNYIYTNNQAGWNFGTGITEYNVTCNVYNGTNPLVGVANYSSFTA